MSTNKPEQRVEKHKYRRGYEGMQVLLQRFGFLSVLKFLPRPN